jgi:hypothetical protein
MRQGRFAAASSVFVALLWACSRFSSADDVTADAGDAAVPGAISFYCPAPAGSCAFLTQSCCVAVVDGGVAGSCMTAGEHCGAGANQVFCDQRRPCQIALDAQAATCCAHGGVDECAVEACEGYEVCRAGAIPSECTDVNKHCKATDNSGYTLCQP